MSNDNKHPLDPEELFKRLGDKQAGSDEPLDDFEKEALEGFAMLGDEQQARDAYQEVLVRLSAKSGSEQKPERKTRVVWLSAAAMVAMLLIVGVVWLNNSHGPASEDLAMNKPQEDMMPKPAEEPLPAVETEEPVNEPSQAASTKQKDASITAPELSQDIDKPAYAPPVAFEKQLESKEQPDEKPKEHAREETMNNGSPASGEASGNYEGYATITTEDAKKSGSPGTVFKEESEKSLAKTDQADKYKLKDEEKDQQFRNKNNADDTDALAGDLAANAPVTSQPGKLQEVVSKNEAASASGAEYRKAKTRAAQNTVGDYYSPGEKALKNHIITNAGSKALSGTYAIKALVASDGKLKVASVTATSGHCSDCAQAIKKILDGMAGWKACPDLVFSLTF